MTAASGTLGKVDGVETGQSGPLFLGVDLAWSTGRTGLAVVDDAGRLTACGRVKTDDEISDWLAAQKGQVIVAAVDAPLIVPNEAGQRLPERLIGQSFGGFGASAHTSNRRRFGGCETRAAGRQPSTRRSLGAGCRLTVALTSMSSSCWSRNSGDATNPTSTT